MKYNTIAKIMMFIWIFAIMSYSQEKKIKKSEFDDLMIDLRLRKQSLEMEKNYLRKFLDSLNYIDSLREELEKCKKSILLNDTLKEFGIYENRFPNFGSKNLNYYLISGNRKYSRD